MQYKSSVTLLVVLAALAPLLYGRGWVEQLSAAASGAPQSCDAAYEEIVTDLTLTPPDVIEEFWQWAWEQPYFEDDSTMVIADEATMPGLHEVVAYSRDGSGEWVVGSGTFDVSVVYFLAEDMDTFIDDRSGVAVEWDASVTVYVAAGTFTNPREDTRPVVAFLMANRTSTEADENLVATLTTFTPSFETESLASAECIALDIFSAMNDIPSKMQSAIAQSQGIVAAQAGSGGVIPCDVENPSCECQCLMDFEFNKRVCAEALRLGTLLCAGGLIGGILICFLGCTVISPGAGPAAVAAWQACLQACFKWLSYGIGICLLEMARDYANCMKNAYATRNVCLEWCERQ